MKQPRLETDSKGNKILYVYYTGDRYNQAIAEGEERFNVTDDPTVTVIALPGGIDCYPNYNHRPKRKADVSFSKFYIGGIRWD